MPARRIRIPASGVQRSLLIAGIFFIAINLRPALASVGPLVGAIRADTGLSHAGLGLLTTLPLLAFGIVSVFAPLATRSLGFGGALAAALALLSVGTGLRVADSVGLLFSGTILLGVGIALGNVLLPALVKRDFAHRSGAMTSLYSSAMALGASIAAGVSVPLSLQIGWRGALGFWAIPAAAAFMVWLPQLRTRLREGRPSHRQHRSLWGLTGSILAWQVALFMGLQSLTFYVILAWLPDLLQTRGYDPAEAGWMLALSQAIGILGSAIVPILAGRVDDQRSLVGGLCLLEAIALGGLTVSTLGWLGVAWVSILGFVLGGTFGLSLLFLVIRSPDAETTTQLSGMAQSIGYLIAAAGPVAFGLLYDFTDTWTIPLFFLVIVLLGKLMAGLPAGRPGHVRPAS